MRGPACLALVFALLAAPALAHPHVWVSVETEIEIDAEAKAVELVQAWTYDAMYSSYALFGLDRDGDGRYSPAELSGLLATITSSLREKRHFTKASLEGARVELSEAADSSLQVNGEGRLVLRFRERCLAPQPLQGRALRVEVADPEYFVDFQFSKDRFATISGRSGACSATLHDDQPPAGSDPQALMNALIAGPLQTLASAVTVR